MLTHHDAVFTYTATSFFNSFCEVWVFLKVRSTFLKGETSSFLILPLDGNVQKAGRRFNKSIHLQEQATDVTSPVKTYSAPSPTPPATVPDSLQQIWPWEQKTKRIKTWNPVKEDCKVIDPILAARNIKGIYKGEMYKVDLNPIQIQLRGKSFSKPNMETDVTLSRGARQRAVIWELFRHWHSCLATGNFSRCRGRNPP